VLLAADAVRGWNAPAESAEPIDALRGARVLAVSGIGDPRAFEAQLRQVGAAVESATFSDHHAYDDADVARLVRRAEQVDRVVCTLKDAVKLGPRWPRQARALWYVSQRVTVERGGPVLEDLLDRLLAARSPAADPAA
jgi:tetraacyldisaccharide 4'-kinase